VLFGTDNVGLIICVDILGDCTQAPDNKASIRDRIFKKKKGSPGRRHSDFGTLRVAKEVLEEFE
jgi:hypothetical protein